jgi:glycosyltransferase involved in cell wall biosynthesis
VRLYWVSVMLVNGRFLTRPATGVDRFAIELVTAYAQWTGRPVEVAIPVGAPLHWRFDDISARVQSIGLRKGHYWEQTDLPKAAGSRPVIGLCNSGPILRENQLVVVHDVATFANSRNFSYAFRAWYRVMLAALVRRARVVASVSRFSAGELMRYLGVRARGIEIITEGGEHIMREAADRSILSRLGLHDRRYVLAVGNKSPNKNFALVTAAVALLDDPSIRVVAVGSGNSRVFSGADIQSEKIIHAGYVTDPELRALYENAACFLFPSHYEGFGLPPLEAMCCGCPVIVSDCASLPEICGNAALYCDPNDPRSLSEQIRRLLQSASIVNELKAAGLERAREFGWDKAARQFEDIVRTRLN